MKFIKRFYCWILFLIRSRHFVAFLSYKFWFFLWKSDFFAILYRMLIEFVNLMACKMIFESHLCEFVAKNKEIHRENSQSIDPDWNREKWVSFYNVFYVLELICKLYFMLINFCVQLNSMKNCKINEKLNNFIVMHSERDFPLVSYEVTNVASAIFLAHWKRFQLQTILQISSS